MIFVYIGGVENINSYLNCLLLANLCLIHFVAIIIAGDALEKNFTLYVKRFNHCSKLILKLYVVCISFHILCLDSITLAYNWLLKFVLSILELNYIFLCLFLQIP